MMLEGQTDAGHERKGRKGKAEGRKERTCVKSRGLQVILLCLNRMIVMSPAMW